MKKILVLVLTICLLTLPLVSCFGQSMSKYVDKFEKSGGTTSSLSKSEIEDLADTAGVDADDYGIKKVVKLKSTSGRYAYIIECGSSDDAKDLVEEIEDYIYILGIYYDYDLDTRSEGKFVFAGVTSVIETVLD